MKWILFIFILAGCKEELWIDDQCDKDTIQQIKEAVNYLNNWTFQELGDSLIEIAGYDQVDHDTIFLRDQNEARRDFIVCFYEDPEGYKPTIAGWGVFHGDISLFINHISSASRIRIFVAHELGHYIGLKHLEDPKAVMNPYPNTYEYNSSDTNELHRIYGN